MVGDDVRGIAAGDDADVAGSGAAIFLNEAVPAVLVEVCDGDGRNGDCADAFFGPVAGVAGEAFDLDRHAVAAGGTDAEYSGRPAIEIKGERGLAEFGESHEARAEQADFFFDGPEEGERRVGQLVAVDIEDGGEQDGGAGAVVGAEAGAFGGADDDIALALGARTHADGHRVYVSGEHTARAAGGAGEFKNEIADLAFDRRAFVGVVGRESASFDADFGELHADVVHDGGFFAGAAGNGHHFHDHFQGVGVGHWLRGSAGGHLGRSSFVAVN